MPIALYKKSLSYKLSSIMKRIIYSAILLIVVASCAVESISPRQPIRFSRSSEQLAKQVIAALQRTSSLEYIAMLPTPENFYQIMDEYDIVYGESLTEAKREFGAHYKSQLIPIVESSFGRTIQEGMRRGISWDAARFERVVSFERRGERFGEAQVTIEFSTNGELHRVLLGKVLIVNGEWRVSQFMELL